MKAVSAKELAKCAEAKGWALARIAGSHHIHTMAGRIEWVVIPVYGNQTLTKTSLPAGRSSTVSTSNPAIQRRNRRETKAPGSADFARQNPPRRLSLRL